MFSTVKIQSCYASNWTQNWDNSTGRQVVGGTTIPVLKNQNQKMIYLLFVDKKPNKNMQPEE